MGILQARILEWVAMPSFRGSSQPKDRIQVSHIAGGFFTIWATREAPKSVFWVGGLSLLQGIFLTQELNWGFLHCRRILYQLNYQGSPSVFPNFRHICSWIEEALANHPHPGRGMETLPSVRSFDTALWPIAVLRLYLLKSDKKTMTKKLRKEFLTMFSRTSLMPSTLASHTISYWKLLNKSNLIGLCYLWLWNERVFFQG